MEFDTAEAVCAAEIPEGVPDWIKLMPVGNFEAVDGRKWVLNDAEAETFFGRGSQLHRMFRALKVNNNWTESWEIWGHPKFGDTLLNSRPLTPRRFSLTATP